MNSLEGVTARRLRSEHAAHVSDKLWARAFWSPSYCALSTGGAALDTLRPYVEKQRQPHNRRA